MQKFYEKGEFQHRGFSIGETVTTKDGEGVIVAIDLDDLDYAVSFVDDPCIYDCVGRVYLSGTKVSYNNTNDGWGWYDYADLFKITQTKNSISLVSHHPLFSGFERHGDMYDLQFFGVNKVFEGTPVVTDEYIKYSKGDIFRVNLGFAMELPSGKKAQVYPRSGTRKNFNVMLTNAVGVIDNSYRGTNDQWMSEFIAVGDGFMKIGDRILQFEINDVQPQYEFERVTSLGGVDRGGYGSTGV